MPGGGRGPGPKVTSHDRSTEAASPHSFPDDRGVGMLRSWQRTSELSVGPPMVVVGTGGRYDQLSHVRSGMCGAPR